MERKKRLGCADMYNETSTKRMQWQNEMVKNLKENSSQLRGDYGTRLDETKRYFFELDDYMKGDHRALKKGAFRSRFNRFKSQGKSRSKSRRGMEHNTGARRRSTISVGMTQQEYNAAFDRMFHKKLTRESVSDGDGMEKETKTPVYIDHAFIKRHHFHRIMTAYTTVTLVLFYSCAYR